MAVGPVDIEFVLRGDVDAQLRRVSQTVAGESKALQDQVAKFGEAFGESFDKSSDSIAGMQEKLRALKAIYAELSEEGRNSEFGRILTEQIGGLENSIKRAEGQNRSFMDSIKGLPGPVGAAASEMEMMTKAALRFIATPIGAVIAAIVVALKALTTWFKRSEEGENALARTSAIFKQVLESLLDPVEKVGEWLFKAFTKPKEALGDLVEFMKGQVINRLDAIGDAARGIMKIFQGEWKSGLTDIKNASTQFVTGIEDAGPKLTNWMTDAVGKTKARVDLTRQLNQWEAKSRDFALERAKAETKISELRFKATDTDTPASERLSYMKQAASEVNALYNKEISLAQDKYDISKGLADLDDKTKADKQELINQEANIVRLQGQRADELRSLSRQTNTLAKQAAESDITGVEKLAAELEALNKQILDAGDAERKQMAERIIQLQKELQLRMDVAEAAILAARNTEAPEKVNPVNFDVDNTFATKIKGAGLELEKLRKKMDENIKKATELGTKTLDPETVKRFAGYVNDALYGVAEITNQYREQLGLTEDQVEALNHAIDFASGIADIASGNYVSGAVKIIGGLISTLGGITEKMSVHFEDLREEIDRTVSSINTAQESLSNLGSNNASLSLARLEKELKKLKKEAESLNYATRNVGYGQLFEMDLINILQGYVNNYKLIKGEIEELTKKLISGNLNNDQRESIEALLESYNAVAGKIDDITSQLTGTTFTQLSDSLAEAFLSGIEGAEAWGDSVDNVIKRIMVSTLSAKYLTAPVQEAMDKLMKNSADGLEPWEASMFKNTIEQLSESVAPAFAAAREALKSIGIDMGASTTDTQGLTGTISGITEETGGMIAGNLMGIRFDLKEVTRQMLQASADMRQALAYQAEIATNTRHNSRLVNILEQLELMNVTLRDKL